MGTGLYAGHTLQVMKKSISMKHLLMYFSGLWACLGCCPLEAQSSIQLGLGLHGQATMTGQTAPGMGNSFQLWAEVPLNTGLALYGALGRQSYSGYNSGFIAFEKIRRSFFG